MPLTMQGVALDNPARPYVIAEAGGNHQHDVATARRLIRAAARAGADAIKFQTFTAAEIAAPGMAVPRGHDAAHDAWLERLGVRELRDLFRHGGLPRAWHKDLQRLATDHGLAFLSTPFSLDAARFLVEELGVPALKIASGDLTFTPLLEYANRSGLPVLLSTGGATADEVDAAVTGPLFGAYQQRHLVLLHCRSVYPCPAEDAGLAVLRAWRWAYPNVALGWSDHTLSVDVVPALAVAAGCSVVEKHLRCAGDQTSVDAAHALDPRAFAQMVQTVRQVHAIYGSPEKAPLAAERHDRLYARRDPLDWLRPVQAAREGRWA